MSESGEVRESKIAFWFWWYRLIGCVLIIVSTWFVVSGVVVMFEEGLRLGIDNAWMYFVSVIGVGVFFLFAGGYLLVKAEKYRRPVAKQAERD